MYTARGVSVSEYPQNNVALQAPSPPRPTQRRRRCTDRPRPASPHRPHRRIHHRRVHSHGTARRKASLCQCPQETLPLLQTRQASKDGRLCRLERNHLPTNTWSAQKRGNQRPAVTRRSRSVWPTARSLSQEQSMDQQSVLLPLTRSPTSPPLGYALLTFLPKNLFEQFHR